MLMATTRRLGTTLLVAGALCVPAAAWAQAPAPPPGIGVKLLQGPADGADNPRAHEYIVDHLAPGTTISRQVGFSNGDAVPMDMTFYAAAADISAGAFVAQPGRAANDLTTWTTFAPASATVQPGQTLPVTVTIVVPAGATAGERYAAALAETSAGPSDAGGVTTVSRVGIRMYLSVGPGGAPATAFTITALTASRDEQDRAVVTAAVHNTGERAVDVSGELELSDGPSSLSAGPFAVGTAPTLAPGDDATIVIPLDAGLPAGPWDARLTLRSGLHSEVGSGSITFPDSAGSNATPVDVVATTGSLPVVPVAAAGLTVLVAGLTWSVRHRIPYPRKRLA